MSNILATGIRNAEHLAVFDQIAEERLAAIDLSVLLVYMVDTVPASVLPILAEQFDILGYKGWRFVTDNTQVVAPEILIGAFEARVISDSGTTEASECLRDFIESLEAVDTDRPDPAVLELQQRELIKSAIELHRYKGTPWSIKEALRRIGFGGAELVEGVGQYYDGTFYHNGVVTYSGLANWACFRVIFDLGNVKGISEQQTIDLQALIEEYKPARCKLVDLAFVKNIEDEVTITESVTFALSVPAIGDSFTPYYNAVHTYNGVTQHTGYAEEIPISQEN